MKFYFSFNISFVFFLPGRRTACLVCPELRTDKKEGEEKESEKKGNPTGKGRKGGKE